MEKSEFEGMAIEGLHELVEHHENPERSRLPSSDAAEGHGSTNSSEEEKRVP